MKNKRSIYKTRKHPFWYIWASCFFCVFMINKKKHELVRGPSNEHCYGQRRTPGDDNTSHDTLKLKDSVPLPLLWNCKTLMKFSENKLKIFFYEVWWKQFYHQTCEDKKNFFNLNKVALLYNDSNEYHQNPHVPHFYQS